MKIGDTVYIRGTIDEIRKDVVIIKNEGGYFGTVPEEVQTDIGDYSDKLWLNSRNRAFDEVLEIAAKIIEGQMKQSERFNGDGCRELAKTHQDQAYGAQMVKQAVLRLKEGKE